ncbi:hypothetical protein BO85DRAFT_307849 [Aspergillus piperis CBS 112811]|uniref:Uncharacterized protein n=1 Tax=Aspergillus piperis CBS 112811 TaxID=1448313 RepID=A0A8G1VLJ8_9EURO|nr:hypothetical protein BO85DRAFT_307849 [Aspergillus piperis CBS 112811]RAH57666.1 hypothetical protein BO85DRAFT_307849 [Aspergillus piperis CBS 112811]
MHCFCFNLLQHLFLLRFPSGTCLSPVFVRVLVLNVSFLFSFIFLIWWISREIDFICCLWDLIFCFCCFPVTFLILFDFLLQLCSYTLDFSWIFCF